MRKRSSRLWDSCTRELGLETKLEKRWFIAAFILLFLYLWLCQYLRNFLSFDVSAGIVSLILFPALQALPLSILGVILFGKLQIENVSDGDHAPRFRRFFPAIVFVL
ncbi:MAG: hypothetical protein PUD70_08425, partial [Firmicutes bacterium]|nr:hypothetical protein [Bacillota bacterium]